MSTIVLSSEDEDDCSILDPTEQSSLQPPHAVFIFEGKLNECLYREDELEHNKDEENEAICKPEFEEESNMFPKVSASLLTELFDENKQCEAFSSQLEQTDEDYQSLFEEETCDFNNLVHSPENNIEEPQSRATIAQDNNAVFQRLAEAITKALSSEVSDQTLLNKKQCESNSLNSGENTNLTNESSGDNSLKNFENIELWNQNNLSSQPRTEVNTNYLSVKNTTGVKRRGRKPGSKNSKHLINESTRDDSLNNFENIELLHQSNLSSQPRTEVNCNQSPVKNSSGGKKRGRKPGSKNAKHFINESTSDNLLHLTDESARDNSFNNFENVVPLNQINLSSQSHQEVNSNLTQPMKITTGGKRRGRKPGSKNTKHLINDSSRDDSLNNFENIELLHQSNLSSQPRTEVNCNQSPVKNTSGGKKRGRKPGSKNAKHFMNESTSDNLLNHFENIELLNQRNLSSQPCTEVNSNYTSAENTTDTTRVIKYGREPCHKIAKSNPEIENNLVNNTVKKEKPERKPYHRITSMPSSKMVDSRAKVKCGESSNLKKSIGPNANLINTKYVENPLGEEKDNQVSNAKIYQECSTIGKEIPDTDSSGNNSSNLFPDFRSILVSVQNSTITNENSLNKTNATVKNIKQTNVMTPAERLYLQDVRSNLTGNVYQNIEIAKEDFIRCYAIMFDDSVENMCLKLADVLLLTMNEVKNYTERINAVKKFANDQLQTKEINLYYNSLTNSIAGYRTCFCPVFSVVVHQIILEKEVAYQHKALIIALFMKLFLRVSTLSPEYSNSLILAKYSITYLLKHYISSVTELISKPLHEIFWQNDTDFERNCWFILDFFPGSFQKETHPPKDTLDENNKTTTDTQCISALRQLQPVINREVAKTSVIVRNEFYHQQHFLTNVVEDRNPTTDHIRSKFNQETNATSISLPTINNESIPCDTTNINNKVGDLSLVQNHQQTRLTNLQPDFKGSNEVNKAHGTAYGKRKACDSEDCSNKSIKITANLNTNACSQQDISNYTQANIATPLLSQILSSSSQRNCTYTDRLSQNLLSSEQNSETRGGFHSKYDICIRTDRTVAPNSDKNILFEDPTRKEKLPSYKYPSSQSHHKLQLKPRPLNLTSTRSFAYPYKKPSENKSFSVGFNQFNNQTRYQAYSVVQPNEYVHQINNRSSQSYPTSFIPDLNYHNQMTPPSYYPPPYTNAPIVNHQSSSNWPTNPNAVPSFQINGFPSPYGYTRPYGCTPYRLDPTLNVNSEFINATSNNASSVTNTGTSRLNTFHSTLPGQVKLIRSNSGVTINNYTFNT